MRSNMTQPEIDIKRYIKFGYSIDDACKQVESMTLNRHTKLINQIKSELLKSK